MEGVEEVGRVERSLEGRGSDGWVGEAGRGMNDETNGTIFFFFSLSLSLC